MIIYIAIPDYDTPDARKEYLSAGKHDTHIISEDVLLGDYIICYSRTSTGLYGYSMFKTTLGKCHWDNSNHGSHGARGVVESNGITYLILANSRKNAHSADIVYCQWDTGKELYREQISVDGDGITIWPMWKSEHVIINIFYYDSDGNKI